LGKLVEDYPFRMELVQCNLDSRKELRDALTGVDQVVWSASGFKPPAGNFISKIQSLLKIKVSQAFGRILDIRGPALCCKTLMKLDRQQKSSAFTRGQLASPEFEHVPRMVLLSSAAVTRPSWDEETREQFKEAAEIAIVKLNPLNVLGTKLRGENRVRRLDFPYTIVRSTGINSTHPDGSFQLASGDTLVGRINPRDLAVALATTLLTPEATSKTVEIATTPAGFLGSRGAKSALQAGFSKIPSDTELEAQSSQAGTDKIDARAGKEAASAGNDESTVA